MKINKKLWKSLARYGNMYLLITITEIADAGTNHRTVP